MISNIRLYQTISEIIINFIKAWQGQDQLGHQERCKTISHQSLPPLLYELLQQNLWWKKKVSKELSILLFSFSCASHTVKLYYLEYILWRYWPQAGPTFIGLYPGNSEKQPLRNRNPYASWKWSQKAQTNTNTTTATEKSESNMQH